MSGGTPFRANRCLVGYLFRVVVSCMSRNVQSLHFASAICSRWSADHSITLPFLFLATCHLFKQSIFSPSFVVYWFIIFWILSAHDKSFQGFHPAIRRPDQDAILDSITATARVSKRTWSFLLTRAYSIGSLSTVALRRLALCVRLPVDNVKAVSDPLG